MKTLLTAALAAFAAVAACGQIDTNRVVAIVNGDEIRGAEYYHRMEYLGNVGTSNGQAFQQSPPGFLTIEQLVTERLALQLAKKLGIVPTDAEIDSEIAFRQKDNPKMLEQWTATGQSTDDLRYQMKLQIAEFKIQTNGITVTDQEVSDFYAKNPTMFTQAKTYKLRVITVKSEADKQPVDKALSAGIAFGDAAKQFSLPEAGGKLGGVIPPLSVDKIPPAILTVLSNTKIGALTDWVATGATFSRFFVDDVQAPKTSPLDDLLRIKIRRKLMMDRGGVKNDIAKEMKDMRAQSKIEIKQAEFQDAYDKMMKAYFQGG